MDKDCIDPETLDDAARVEYELRQIELRTLSEHLTEPIDGRLDKALINSWKKPQICNEHCNPICFRRNFCIGKTDDNIIIINGKEHHNDYYFCVISDLRGWSKFQVNLNDIRIIKEMMGKTESEGSDGEV